MMSNCRHIKRGVGLSGYTPLNISYDAKSLFWIKTHIIYFQRFTISLLIFLYVMNK